jgi:hypothetical protein
LNAKSEFLGLWYAKVAANFQRQVIVDFIVPWNSASPVCAQMAPPRVIAAFAEQCATMCSEMYQ